MGARWFSWTTFIFSMYFNGHPVYFMLVLTATPYSPCFSDTLFYVSVCPSAELCSSHFDISINYLCVCLTKQLRDYWIRVIPGAIGSKYFVFNSAI
jgi:hypothetical protein